MKEVEIDRDVTLCCNVAARLQREGNEAESLALISAACALRNSKPDDGTAERERCAECKSQRSPEAWWSNAVAVSMALMLLAVAANSLVRGDIRMAIGFLIDGMVLAFSVAMFRGWFR